MVKIHDNNGGSYACNGAVDCSGETTTNLQEKVTCISCLKLIIKEWRRQVKEFSGQPKRNAVIGLGLANARLEKLNEVRKR